MENILIKIFPVKTMNIGDDEDDYTLKKTQTHNTFVLTEGNHHNACENSLEPLSQFPYVVFRIGMINYTSRKREFLCTYNKLIVHVPWWAVQINSF